ncbi:hypothetical protein [Saccharopolyspora gregorii]|uniref:Cell division protein FtsL n=1 Tax=Saccharopolyspora gregorii TaxID=33914 RepID=A0ABP6RN13_9PSEU|nr:hypothetical protein [Saccharopolyspora gregorii]
MTAPARAKTSASRTGSAAKKKEPAKRKAASTTATAPQTKTQKKTPAKARGRSAAAERAYARREERRDRTSRETAERRPRRQRQAAEQRQPRQWRLAAVRPRARQLQAKVATSRVPLVVAVMAVLGVGLVATLSLSIAAVGGSYQLQQVEQEVTALNEHREQLLREVSNIDSTPALQRKATELGMVPPPGPPAHLVVNPDGTIRVVGEPQQASAPPAPPAPKPPAPADAQQPPAAPNPPVEQGAPQPDPAQRQAATIPAVEGD